MREWAALALMLVSIDRSTASAADWSTVVEAPPRTFNVETWAGGDGNDRSVSVYGGITASPFGDIRAEGFRVRAATGYGTYSYTRSYAVNDRRAWQEFRGSMTTADIMAGYQVHIGAWIVKTFVGATQETHTLTPIGNGTLAIDERNEVQGERLGLKGAVETWLNIQNAAFLQTDMSWSQPFQAYGARLRAGYRINPAISTGLEAGVHGNANHDAGRAGAFLRFEWTAGEISASAGAAANHHEITGPYGSMAIMLRF